ncbi:MarR family winged helix-turn-helix transcriptional regulator [Hymenobacter negativus]|uniref:MarR family transcriptional regulator n=1 Tax=Hymenobacter negativus TaxID=2795026 RepID=A0ABS0Q562_9BACT|nr:MULTISPECIES: MarR family transcriptional regulator [Bacteria]MBH8557760.1 MarR family transcriptional regulator [Hymenobacter negativus]MBH8567715.1 MarR family transcriptional regulator [Hymenobacter negativus]MBR7207449.1 MarR family transcriptional regulator [Microvirga sp. STS02]
MSDQSDTLHLAAELRTVVSRLVKKLRSHSQTHSSLSLTERAVVKLLAQHGQLLPSELAAQEKVTTQSMSQILSHLAELGYITRQPSATDKRKVLISLSAAGEALIPAMQQETNEWLHQALQKTCSAQELASLREALPALTKLVDFD